MPSSETSEIPDALLLERFVDQWDHGAFRDLVSRHGPMVLGICRRILRDDYAAEDAFQATFLLLVRKAAAVRKRQSVGPWLFGVARRVALEARGAAARRPRTLDRDPAVVAAGDHHDPACERERDELHAALLEELARLPDKYRVPLVLCYFEGLTHEIAAHRLGWPIGSVRGRIARGRDLLGARLVRRGWKPAAVLVALSLLPERVGAVPVALLDATIRPAIQVLAGERVLRREVPNRVANLERKVRKAMRLSLLKSFAVIALGTIVIGTTLAAVLPRAIAAAADTAQVRAEKQKLQGTWEVVSCEESGMKLEDVAGYTLKFDGDSFAMMEDDRVVGKGPFTLDPSRSPMEMDIAFQEGKMEGKTGRAIYAWDGTNLRFCGAKERGTRPTEFQTTPGDERLLLLLKRQ
jgi:RNA polymerase sigma factor (sigma-70 family)